MCTSSLPILNNYNTAAGLCLPVTRRIQAEYRPLFPAQQPETESRAGKAALLAAFNAQLAEWAPMLQRFLKDHDDQARAPKP